MTRWIPWMLCGLSALAVAYALVLLLNAGSALADARSEAARLRERSDLALTIVRRDWLGRDLTSITRLSRELEKNGAIVGTEAGSFKLGDLVFETKDGVVTDVHYID